MAFQCCTLHADTDFRPRSSDPLFVNTKHGLLQLRRECFDFKEMESTISLSRQSCKMSMVKIKNKDKKLALTFLKWYIT